MTDLTTTLTQWNKFKPKTLRSYVREIALDMLSLKNKFIDIENVLKKPRVQFLYIHHIFDDEIESFEKILNILSKYHTFISYSDAVNKICSGNIDKAYLSISSDDGFKNNLSAIKILNKYNIKGCFFVNPDTIGLKDFSKIKSFCKTRLYCPPTEFMDWNDIEYLIENGHEIGSHTIGHINIAKTDIRTVEENIYKSHEILTKKTGNTCHFSFPYGRFFHFKKEAYNIVFKAGFISCASAERGCHISNNKKIKLNNILIRRDHVICNWNINHILHFIIKNSINSSFKNNFYPVDCD